MLRTDGLLVGRGLLSIEPPGWDAVIRQAWTRVLDSGSEVFGEWLLGRDAAFAVTASDTETVIYALHDDVALEPIERVPGVPGTLPTGRIWEEMGIKRHVVTCLDADGIWLSVVTDAGSTLLLVSNRGEVASKIAVDAGVLPVGVDERSVYCLALQEDGGFSLAAVAR